MTNFIETVRKSMDLHNSLLCVGLDSEYGKLPDSVKREPHPQYAFNRRIIDATHDLVCAYKPNTAFYEARGDEGIRELKMTCDYLKSAYPAIPIILDAKRADIGNTNNGYVAFAFDYLAADAITVHPYLGREAIQPFLDRKDKGVIILCRTSNPGAGELQDIKVYTDSGSASDAASAGFVGMAFYTYIAGKIVREWNVNGNCLLVVGATYPQELKTVREIVGDMTLLVPGIGAQGGDVEATLINGLTNDGKGLIINVSRSVIFAGNGNDFDQKARGEAENIRNTIHAYRKRT